MSRHYAPHQSATAEADVLLARFDSTLRHSAFVFGETPVYADFALLGIIGNFTFRGWNTLAAGQIALADWRERLTAWRY